MSEACILIWVARNESTPISSKAKRATFVPENEKRKKKKGNLMFFGHIEAPVGQTHSPSIIIQLQ